MSPKSRLSSPTLFVCHSCRLRNSQRRQLYTTQPPIFVATRRSLHTTRSLGKSSLHLPLEKDAKPAYAHLTNRSLIRLQGQDVVHFLDGLLPCKLQQLSIQQSGPIFTTFLNARGRILHDIFIYPPSTSNSDGPWYLDVDERSAGVVFSHLKKHKLRSKFKLEKVGPEGAGVYYIWPTLDGSTQQSGIKIGGQDPRPLMGTRFLSFDTRSSPGPGTILQQTATELSLGDYNLHRMLIGHAEGPSELISGAALPQESNIDFSGGVDFHKGCYLGQELTIRTHHTGVVRKRILPCQIYPETRIVPSSDNVPVYDASVQVSQPAAESNISKIRSSGGKAGRSTGKWLGGVGNIGLALCRLEMMTDIQLTAEGTQYDPTDTFSVIWEDGDANSCGETAVRQVKIKPFVPDWLRNGIDAGIKARNDRGVKKRQELDNDEHE